MPDLLCSYVLIMLFAVKWLLVGFVSQMVDLFISHFSVSFNNMCINEKKKKLKM